MPLSAPPSILAAFTTIKITIPLSTWSLFYSHVALASGASCTVCALLAPSPSSPASSPSLHGGFEERVILTSTAGRFRHNVATYGSHRRISSLRSSRRCPDSADRSSVEESRCRTEILSTDTVLLLLWLRNTVQRLSPRSSDLPGASRWKPAFGPSVGETGTSSATTSHAGGIKMIAG